MAKVSVIIPIYNIEQYLSQCLDSVINQTYKNLEIICINDCSTDNSLDIIKKYSKKDNRIKIFNREKNGGLSAARNSGINIATGKYIYFIDADDWIDDNYIENMVNAINLSNTKIVLNTNIIYEFEDNRKNCQHAPHLTANCVHDTYISSQRSVYNIIWNSCCHFYNLDFLNRHKLRFPQGYTSEDIYFQAITYPYTDNVYVIRSGQYHYRIRPNSICDNYKKFPLKQIEMNLNIFKLVINFYKNRGLLNKLNIKLFTDLFFNGDGDIEDKRVIYEQVKEFFISIKPYVEKNKHLYYNTELAFFKDLISNFEHSLNINYLKLFYFEIIRKNREKITL